MTSYWRETAREVLLALDLREGDPEAARKVFDAYPFRARELWPYKVWLSEVRRVYPWLRKRTAAEKGRLI